jgi:hypothetical protein
VFAGWKGRRGWDVRMERGGCCEEGKGRGLLDGFYMPEKKIINDMMALFSRQPGMHAAFARPFFFPNLFYYYLSPTKPRK